MEDLKTDAEITWCPGCGNFSILVMYDNSDKLSKNKKLL
ncbi:hypothetical protein ES703_71732 [subsurface metagenome]